MKNDKEALAKKRMKILRLFSKNPEKDIYELKFNSKISISEEAMMLMKTDGLKMLVVDELRRLKRKITETIDETIENITKE